MPRTFIATYESLYRFEVPKRVFLLKKEDIKDEDERPGVWWVKWGVFHYIDKNGKEHEIEGEEHSEHKRPNNVEELEEEECDDDDEEDEEEEDEEEEDEEEDAKSANSSTYGGGCRRICRFCREECSCWNYNSDHEVVCEGCAEEIEEEEKESMKARGAMDGDGFVVCEHCGKGGGAHASDDCPDKQFVVCGEKGCEGHWNKKCCYDHPKAEAEKAK